MQISAHDKNGISVSASRAHRRINYFCPECKQALRLRGGRRRQLHFYHLSFHLPCRQSGKTIFHLQTQLFLQKQIAPEKVFLEHPFPQISRIADVAWPSQKIIFEVQCSPISAEEVMQRNSDYSKIGYQVVWILHDKRFNHFHLSAAEEALHSSPHFFSNINSLGKGFVYDQFEEILAGKRKMKSLPFPVNVKELTLLPQMPKQFPGHLAQVLKKRVQNWQISLKGDLFHRVDSPNLSTIKSSSPKRKCWHPIGSFLRALFHHLIENACH